MQTYRARLRMRSATLTPWQADTLFGHWCWLILYHEGEAKLKSFLTSFGEGEPPLVLSNGFPMGDETCWLPRPIVPRSRGASRAKSEMVQAMQRTKAVKSIRFVTLDEFNQLCRGEEVHFHEREELSRTRPVLKNQINRLTGATTPRKEEAGGNLYGVEEIVFVDPSGVRPKPLDVAFYVKAEDDYWADRAEALFGYLVRSGYGAKKSAGYGQVELVGWEPFDGFESPDGTNGFISLSNWVPAQDDPRRGFYDTLVKYGKLGEELAVGENPFKFPLTMLAAGSSFYVEGEVAEAYGRLVRGIAPAKEEVVQYGIAFAVPAYLASSPVDVA
jgi:CRISPR-associated protein Csm4